MGLSEVFWNFVFDVVVGGMAPCFAWRWHSHGSVDVLNNLGVQILGRRNLLPRHAFVILVSLLHLVSRVQVLDQQRKHVSQLNCVLHARLLNKHLADLSGLVAVSAVLSLSSLAELLQLPNFLQKHVLLLGLISCLTLVQLSLCLDHSFECLFIGSKLFNLNLGTLVIEVGQALKGLGLAVELNDCFHDFWVVVPVLVSEEVACEDPNFSLASSLRK